MAFVKNGLCKECNEKSIREYKERQRQAGELGGDIVLKSNTYNPAEPEPPAVTTVASDDNVARCPKCKSTSLSGSKKGFGIGKAVVGAALTGGIGLVAGNIGAKKVRVTCLKCGHQFWAGKGG